MEEDKYTFLDTSGPHGLFYPTLTACLLAIAQADLIEYSEGIVVCDDEDILYYEQRNKKFHWWNLKFKKLTTDDLIMAEDNTTATIIYTTPIEGMEIEVTVDVARGDTIPFIARKLVNGVTKCFSDFVNQYIADKLNNDN